MNIKTTATLIREDWEPRGIGYCAHIALHGFLLLRDQGVKIECGYAGWRVNGRHNAGVVIHHPKANGVTVSQGEDNYLYHTWLRTKNNEILDFSTYELPAKVAALNEADGEDVECQWAPLFLLTDELDTYEEVCLGYKTGARFYETNETVRASVLRYLCQQYPSIAPTLARAHGPF